MFRYRYIYTCTRTRVHRKWYARMTYMLISVLRAWKVLPKLLAKLVGSLQDAPGQRPGASEPWLRRFRV